MMASRLGRALTSSRPSRATYGAVKCALFVVVPLAVALGQPDAPAQLAVWREALLIAGLVLSYIVAAFCLLRGVLVVYDAAPLIRRESRSSAIRPAKQTEATKAEAR